MIKYSKYNCYKDLNTMLSYKEATEMIDSAKAVNLEQLVEIAAKTELYKKVFYGFGNKKNQEEDFITRLNKIYDSFSDEEKKAYPEMVKERIKENEDEARKEYLSRTSKIDCKSEAGSEDGEAFEIKVIEAKPKNKYITSKFTRLFNVPLPKNFKANDSGVFIWDAKTSDYIRVAQAVTIKEINYSEDETKEYLTMQYINDRTGKIFEICMATEELAKNNYATLISAGVVIENTKLFTAYINAVKTANKECKKIPYGIANMAYGYITTEEGCTDFNTFVGLDENSKVIPMPQYKSLDKTIFMERGTTTGFIEFLDEVSKGKYTTDFQMVVAASLAGITQAYVNDTLDMVAPPTYIFIGQSSIGKNLLAAIANNIWAAPRGNGTKNLICTSDSSKIFAAAMKHHIKYLPFIIADVQDLINNSKEWGINEVINLIFQHANGQSGGKASTDGEVRDNAKFWNCAQILFNENDCFTDNPTITGGADARCTVLQLNVDIGDRLTENELYTYSKKEKENYGQLGKEYILALRNETVDDIVNRFGDIVQELKLIFDVQEKQANSLAMLCLSDELAHKYKLVPENWEVLSPDRLTSWNGVKKITDANEHMYHLLSEHVFADVSFVPNDDPLFKKVINEKAVFDARNKEKNEVRGRILWQKLDNKGNYVACEKKERERSLLLIPRRQLDALFRYLEEENKVTGFSWNKKRWADSGWMLTNNGDYVFKDTFKISVTRPRDSKNRETYYAIVLHEDGEK